MASLASRLAGSPYSSHIEPGEPARLASRVWCLLAILATQCQNLIRKSDLRYSGG